MSFAALVCECLVGVVFAVAAATKLRDTAGFGEFADSVRDLAPPFVARWSRPLAGAVVALEVSVPGLLLVPATARVGLAVAGLLLTGFAVAIGAALRRGAGVACRCFGNTGVPVGRRHLVRTAVLLAAVGFGLAAPHAPPAAVDLASAVAVSLPFAVTLIALDQIVELFAPSAPERVKES